MKASDFLHILLRHITHGVAGWPVIRAEKTTVVAVADHLLYARCSGWTRQNGRLTGRTDQCPSISRCSTNSTKFQFVMWPDDRRLMQPVHVWFLCSVYAISLAFFLPRDATAKRGFSMLKAITWRHWRRESRRYRLMTSVLCRPCP